MNSMIAVHIRPRWMFLWLIILLGSLGAQAQTDAQDTIKIVQLPDVRVYAKYRVRPLDAHEREAYWRRIRDVKKTLPYAKYVAATIIESYEFMQTLPEDEQEDHMKRVERELKAEMEPKMRKLTVGQGKILIKLINRQCGMTGYELLKSFLGGWRAWWWNAFAKIIGTNLKDSYHPESVEDDAVTERIVRLIEIGYL